MGEAVRLVKGAVIHGYPAQALRTEARKGNLALLRIAGKDWVTAQAIREMERKCKRQREFVSGLRDDAGGQPSTISGTRNAELALAALNQSCQRLKKSSGNISRRGGHSTPSNVTYLKS